MDIRIGNGFDVHRLVADRACIVCGVEIPYHLGLLGHSDADVALHALTDAIFGAAALGDIGKHFPDTDPRWKDVDSRLLLREAVRIVSIKGWKIANADITIVAQAPKMAPYIEKMREKVAVDCDVSIDCISVKATTTERLGFIGRGEGIAAMASVLIKR